MNPSAKPEAPPEILTNPTRDQIREAAHARSQAMGASQTYAIVGGAACSLLGSNRDTIDVDIVVPQGSTISARQLLRNQPQHFTIDNRTLHTYFRSEPRVEFEILAPPVMFRERFDETTPVVLVDGGVKVLKPTLILNAKCNSVVNRAVEARKRSDAADILFLLRWCAENKCSGVGEVPNASREFVEWFVSGYGGKELWTNAGFDWDKGGSPSELILNVSDHSVE